MGLRVLIILVILFATGIYRAEAREIAFVVNKKASIESIKLLEVKEIFLGDKQFWGSVKIKPIDYQGSKPIRGSFLDKVLRTNPTTFDNYWISKLFQEGGTPPSKKETFQEVIDEVSRDPGAIGYVYKDEIPDKSGIKVILTVQE